MRITAAMQKAFDDGDERTLSRLLNLKPWEISPIGAYGKCDYPRGSGGAESWDQAVALRRQLEGKPATLGKQISRRGKIS